MKLETIIHGTPVSLPEILDARECRAYRQKELLKLTGTRSIISFSMNIAGAIKHFPLGVAAFEEGTKELRSRIPAKQILHFEESRKNTGPEAFFVLTEEPDAIKRITASIEESHPLGRLFDMDVIRPDGLSVSRSDLGLEPRTCLICGDNAKACARAKTHSTELVLWRTAQILNDYFKGQAADMAAACAVRALLYEVSSTPKPGLVDRNNSGSHSDMDFFTFLDSSAALIPCFRDFFCIGWEYGSEPDRSLFSRLRFAGQEAESHMFAATGGINTHKGLIFASAIVLGSLGKLYAEAMGTRSAVDSSGLIEICRSLGTCSLGDFRNEARTSGEMLYASYRITGARGEAAAGFPSVLTHGLPVLKSRLSMGFSLNDASVLALISMMSRVDDTNMIHRGGRETAEKCKKEAGAILSEITPDTFHEKLSALDAAYIAGNLSPGGCADLLAISLMFLFLESCGMVTPFN